MEYKEIKEINLNNLKEVEKILLDKIEEEKAILKEIMDFDRILNESRIYSVKDMLGFIIESLKCDYDIK